MSIMRSSSRRASRRPSQPPEFYARMLGFSIRAARLMDGRPLEELAPLAGLTVAEWMEVETGQVPPAWELVVWLAQLFGLGPKWLKYMLPLYVGTQPALRQNLACSLITVYPHLLREEVREIKTKEPRWKRMNLNVPVKLHNAFKSLTAAEGKDMTTVLLEFIEFYVAKNSAKRRP